MNFNARLAKLEKVTSGDEAYICPACGKRNWAVDRPAEGASPTCVYCRAPMPEPPPGVVLKEYVGVSLFDI